MNVLETLCHWCIVFVPGMGLLSIALFCLLWLNIGLWPLLITYMIYILVCEPSFLEIEIWKQIRQTTATLCAFADYTHTFSVKGNVFPDPCIYAIHPHGLLTSSMAVHMMDTHSPLSDTILKKGHVAVHSLLFKIPLVREVLLWAGCIPVSKQYMGYSLQQGRSIFVVPGGVKEISASKRGIEQETWHLKKHRGFLKLAKQHSVPIVPIYIEGEQTLLTYDYSFEWFNRVIDAILGISVSSIELCQGFLPHNLVQWQRASRPLERPLTTAHIGTPFLVKDSSSIEEAHKQYMKHVKDLFHSVHKGEKTLIIR